MQKVSLEPCGGYPSRSGCLSGRQRFGYWTCVRWGKGEKELGIISIAVVGHAMSRDDRTKGPSVHTEEEGTEDWALGDIVHSAASPGKDNGTEPISIMFNKVGEHIWKNLGRFLHSEPFKILQFLRFVLMDCPETEMAIAKHWFCFHQTISVLILKNVWGHCLVERSTYGQVSASWQRQPGFWLKYPGTWWNSLCHWS